MTDRAASADGEPAASGYRWPAEWEPHAATWLSWPHNRETWPLQLERVEQAFVAMVRALAGREEVCINVADARAEERLRGLLQQAGVLAEPAGGPAVRFFHIPTDDAWVRDHGPIFLVGEREGARGLAVADFGFDAWGGKYPPWDRDDAVPRRVAAVLRLPRFEAGFVLEGGSVEGDGQGTILTTESCLLNPNRGGPDGVMRTREQVERWLAAWLGAREVLWLGSGIAGDDTDGHVDDITRFVAPDIVVTALEDDAGDVNHAPLRENRRRLRGMRSARGKRLEVVTLPMPPPLVADGDRLPASYANFYLANQVALVPIFDAPSDARALATLRECLPGREVVGIPARDLVVGLGGVHCLTQQQPC